MREILFVFTLLIFVGHALDPRRVHVDGIGFSVLALLAVLALAPFLESAQLPWGTKLVFWRKLAVAENIEDKIGGRIQQELLEAGQIEGPYLGQPGLFEIDDDLRTLALSDPNEALGYLRTEIRQSLNQTARDLANGRTLPSDLEKLLDFVAENGHLWSEQVALMRLLIELTDSALLSGRLRPSDAVRIIGLADTLNESFSIGYSLNFESNPDWLEQGRICEFEHCIENMPLPAIPRSETIEWRKGIEQGIRDGIYDDRPELKHSFIQMLATPVAEDAPEEVDRTGSCPIFGHYCPGGASTVESCPVAAEWVKSDE